MRNSDSIAIISSGDPEKDQRDIASFVHGDDLICAGMCPNGCGGMIEVDAWNAECPKCGFGLFQSGGLKFGSAGLPS